MRERMKNKAERGDGGNLDLKRQKPSIFLIVISWHGLMDKCNNIL